MKRYWTLFLVVLIGAAYAAGYWPERQRRLAVEVEASGLRDRLSEAESRVRLGALLARLLLLTDAIGDKNYGQAQGLSSAFFDEVRAESTRTGPEWRAVLEAVLARRDTVTVALTQGDPAVHGLLREAQLRLRTALGYPPPAEAAAPAAPSPPSPAPKP